MSIESTVANSINDVKTFETKQRVAYQLAAKQLDVVRDKGDLILELIDGANIQGKAPGKGARFDRLG